MSCDIHLFIEYQEKGTSYWECFAGPMYLGQYYDMFGYLSNGTIRSSDRVKSSIDLKGLPKNGISDDANNHLKYLSKDENTENPNWYGHSWLSYKEYKNILYDIERKKENVPTIFKAILSVMKVYKKEGYKTRIVFWFDS